MSRWTVAFRFIGVGWFVGVSILLGVLGGLWVDTKFNTGPFFVIAGLMLGLVTAGYGSYRMLLPLFNDKQKKEDD